MLGPSLAYFRFGLANISLTRNTALKALGHRVYIDQKTSDRTTSSKEARAGIVSPLAKEGRIWLVNNPSVIRNRREFFKQVVGFPVEKHDDILDAMTGAIYVLRL
jgi:predicted phage terminase large subunit-like protein